MSVKNSIVAEQVLDTITKAYQTADGGSQTSSMFKGKKSDFKEALLTITKNSFSSYLDDYKKDHHKKHHNLKTMDGVAKAISEEIKKNRSLNEDWKQVEDAPFSSIK